MTDSCENRKKGFGSWDIERQMRDVMLGIIKKIQNRNAMPTAGCILKLCEME